MPDWISYYAGLIAKGLQTTLSLLVISALLFLLCTYAIFFALRTRRDTVARRLERLADVLFLLALTGTVSSGFVMVYTLL